MEANGRRVEIVETGHVGQKGESVLRAVIADKECNGRIRTYTEMHLLEADWQGDIDFWNSDNVYWHLDPDCQHT